MDQETTGQRIARARRRRGLSQAVLAGLVGRSESWLSQVERGKRNIDSHIVLTRLASVLRAGIEELTSPDRNGTDSGAYKPAKLIEQAMMCYGTSGAGPAAGLIMQKRWLAPPTRTTRRPAMTVPPGMSLA